MRNSTAVDAIPEVQATFTEFIDAFNQLDMERFRQSFNDDATVFYAMREFPDRAAGRREIETRFDTLFGVTRQTLSGPPYLGIRPEDVHIQVLGETAVLTYQVTLGDFIGRRTLVLCNESAGWKIVHFHASTIQRESGSVAP